jgi:hypothetical protein
MFSNRGLTASVRSRDSATECDEDIIISDAQLSALIRKVAGFSDREISETYGLSAGDVDNLVKRLTDRLQSLYGVEGDEKP